MCTIEIGAGAHAAATESKWYAVYTRPSHERLVSSHFASRNIEFYLPMYRTTNIWKNRCKMDVEWPLFPGYIFSRIGWWERARILAVPSVISIVSSGRQALPLPESEIETLRSSLEHLNAQPHPYLNIGEQVRIKTGPLAGMEGIVLRKGNGLRIVLTVEQIMKSIVVEVEQWELETIHGRADSVRCMGR